MGAADSRSQGDPSLRCRVLTIAAVAGRATRRRLAVLVVKQRPTQFKPLAHLCVAGDASINIDGTFGLDEVPQALAYVGEGHPLGKIVATPL